MVKVVNTKTGQVVEYTDVQWKIKRPQLGQCWQLEQDIDKGSVGSPLPSNSDVASTLSSVKDIDGSYLHIVPCQLTNDGVSTFLRYFVKHSLVSNVIVCTEVNDIDIPGAHILITKPDNIVNLIKDSKPLAVIHHMPNSNWGRTNLRPLYWYIHNASFFNAPTPNWCKPERIFSNYMPDKVNKDLDKSLILVNRLGVDLDLYHPEEKKVIVGIVGRISIDKIPEKFLDTLLEWNNPKDIFRFRFIGPRDKHFSDQIIAKCEDKDWISFLTNVPKDNIPQEYRNLDLLLIPSKCETGSYALVEGIASGLPIVARNIGGIPYNSGDAGVILCNTDDELISAIEAFEKREHREEFAAHSIKERSKLSSEIHLSNILITLPKLPEIPVSILMAVFNTPEKWLNQAIDSILAQTYKNWEVVMIDDGSTKEETKKALDKLNNGDNIRLLRLPTNIGAGPARNAGLAHCRYELVALLDPDDIAKPNWLECQVSYLYKHPHLDAVGCGLDGFKDVK